MSKFLLILIAGGFISFGILNISQNNTTTSSTENAVKELSSTRSRDIANSMAQMLLSQISDSATWRVTSPATKNIFGGTATYTVKDTSIAAKDTLIKISVTGNYFNNPVTVNVYAERPKSAWVPVVLRGAWTANGPLNNTISDMYIDGRDRDLKGNLIAGTGIYGISTSVEFKNTQNASIGGTNNKIDYPMQYPENPNVIEEKYNWGGTFPTSPDEAIGVPAGTLKSIAQSGKNGSQYITKIKDLKLPLSGVTYLELDPNTNDKIDLKNSVSKGILVIHNSTTSTKISETKTNKSDKGGHPFEGIIIGDYMFHFHVDVLGGIILLSKNLETSKNCGGNKDHKIFYSSEAVKNATAALGISGGGGTVNTNYGFAKQRAGVRFWWE